MQLYIKNTDFHELLPNLKKVRKYAFALICFLVIFFSAEPNFLHALSSGSYRKQAA